MEDDFSILFEDLPETGQIYPQETQQNRSFPEMTERMTVEGKPLGYLIMYIILAIVCMIAGLVLGGYILIGLASGVLIISTDLLYLVFAAVVALPLSIYAIIKIITKRSIDIGPEGVTIKVKDRIDFSSPWSEIARITTRPNINNSPSQLVIVTRDESEMMITSISISGSKLKEGFQLLQKYSQYHCINVDNEAGW